MDEAWEQGVEMRQGEAIVSKIKEELTLLVALQQCEKEVSVLEVDLAAVEARIESLNDQLAEFEKQVIEGQQALDTLKKQYRSDEADTKVAEAKIVKSQEKLRAVKTNKEYESTLKEIDDMKAKTSQIEDGMLKILEEIEAGEERVVRSHVDLKDVKLDVESQRREIRSQAEQQVTLLASCQKERESLLAQIPPALVEKYNKVKRQGRGIAIAAVVDAVCQVCRMNIPPQLFIELLRMDSMRMCPNCQRIIYPKVALEDE
jgi:uncharacterized protein